MSSVFGLESTPVTELAMVIWSQSRIQAAQSPATIRVWKGLHCSRSRRAGIVERSGTDALLAITIPFAGALARTGRRSISDGWAPATMDPLQGDDISPSG